MSQLKDQAQRTQAILERARNVIVDAGAGTGKTTLLVARLVHLLAPQDDGPCFSLERVAAITFTRKAAGELKLRLRQAVLAESARTDLSPLRKQRLSDAVERLDNATIGTVHSFADRLLRMRPADARISPEYDIAEETDELVWETYSWLLEAVKHGTLAAALADTEFAALAAEASETIQLYMAAGFLTHSEDNEIFTKVGLDWLVRDFISSRDRDLTIPERTGPQLARVNSLVDELHREVIALESDTPGTRTLRRLRDKARQITATEDAAEALRRACSWTHEYRRTDLKMKEHFDGDARGWQAWKWIHDGERGRGKTKEERAGGKLGDELTAPLFAWLAERLIRLRPLILMRYRQVKRAHQVLDQVDLLLELRDLMRRDLPARAFYQARFDHILVDEFQDTDPLQAEILMFLCEQGATAGSLDQVTLTPGKLTIVGDPKQSIYRFRRADIAMYAEVCDRVRKGPVCEAQLSVNFRSTPALIAWVNAAFDHVLGAGGSGPQYDKQAGSVRNLRLSAGRSGEEGPSVHVLPFGEASLSVDESRDLEGEALARYLRWLVEDSQIQILDPDTRKARRPRYGDIAVLIVATQTVHHLLGELDKLRVPHVVRGGTLFMQDTLHQQFLLGLRALSDRSDGVAQAALMRPPFFALGLDELVRARFEPKGEPSSEAIQQYESIAHELRFMRNQVPPGEMARAVLERTGFGRFVAASENGEQRLARLYELCLSFGSRARAQGLDFDGMTALARSWVDAPIRMEAPLPVDADAVQVITVHQAKGLEWPVVALWDGRGSWKAFLPQPALSVDPSSGEWAIALHNLRHDPTGRGMHRRELEKLEHERKRVLYVGATRARDLLIVPQAGAPAEKTMAGTLLLSTASLKPHQVAEYRGERDNWSQTKSGVSMRPVAPLRTELESDWLRAAQDATLPRLVPAGVSSVAHGHSVEAPDEQDPPPRKPRRGRYGAAFGSAVHRALELVLTGRVVDGQTAVEWAARELGLSDHLEEALADVSRTLATLEAQNLGGSMRLEYPIAGSLEPSTLLVGYIDLLIATPEGLVLIDFKTDDPPAGSAAVHYPKYVAQVRGYGQLLESAGVSEGRALRTALLFTGDGSVHWT